MSSLGKYKPSWFDLDRGSLQSLAESVCHSKICLLEDEDDKLCQQCQALPFERFWAGSRVPSEKLEDSIEDSENSETGGSEKRPLRWEVDIMEHLQLVRAVNKIASRKSCAFCRTLTAVHKRAHSTCSGDNEQCFLLPIRGDMNVKISAGKLILHEHHVLLNEENHDMYATNIHILFRSSTPGAAGKARARTNSHFREEKERYTHERCAGTEQHLCRFLDDCDHEIGRDKRIKDGTPFRCIDVKTGKLVEISLEDHYLALSYVWGQVEVSRKDILFGNKINIEKLPRVIQDAIVATEKLGERYLWADLICIDQDDPQDIKRQIEQMDLVYRLADATLIAVTAKDANCSLPGVREPRSVQEHVLRINDRRIYCSLQANDYTVIARSRWRSRGWTFQEGIMTRRALYFLDSEVVFRCKQSTGYEFLDPTGPVAIRLNPEIGSAWMSDDITLGWNFFNYESLVNEYLGRKFSFESDIMSAFLGVTAWLRDRYGRRFIHGLPIDDALTGLMWTFAHGIGTASRRNMFPSWAWADWRAEIKYYQYIYFYRDESRIVGPGPEPFGMDGYPAVKILRQAAIEPDYSETPVRKLRIVTDIRQFKLVPGPPNINLKESTVNDLGLTADADLEELMQLSVLRWELRDIPIAEQYDHHLLNQDGTTIYPQSPVPSIFTDKTYFPKIRFGQWFSGGDPTCHFILLAHVTDPDPEGKPRNRRSKDYRNGKSGDTDEQTQSKTWDHVFSLLIRKLPDGTFERVDLFTFKAKDWFSAMHVSNNRSIYLV
ncbi:hypothetical protein ACJZ2D_016754 [Fusarium nematophilum]